MQSRIPRGCEKAVLKMDLEIAKGAVINKECVFQVMADRLCETFEAFRTWIPNSTIEFEELLLLSNELTTGELIRLSTCKGCKSAILVFR